MLGKYVPENMVRATAVKSALSRQNQSEKTFRLFYCSTTTPNATTKLEKKEDKTVTKIDNRQGGGKNGVSSPSA